jgi:hypothetical protein
MEGWYLERKRVTFSSTNIDRAQTLASRTRGLDRLSVSSLIPRIAPAGRQWRAARSGRPERQRAGRGARKCPRPAAIGAGLPWRARNATAPGRAVAARFVTRLGKCRYQPPRRQRMPGRRCRTASLRARRAPTCLWPLRRQSRIAPPPTPRPTSPRATPPLLAYPPERRTACRWAVAQTARMAVLPYDQPYGCHIVAIRIPYRAI